MTNETWYLMCQVKKKKEKEVYINMLRCSMSSFIRNKILQGRKVVEPFGDIYKERDLLESGRY